MTEKQLKDMKLHTMERVDNDLRVWRVPGGWIYVVRRQGETGAVCTFVPEVKQPDSDYERLKRRAENDSKPNNT